MPFSKQFNQFTGRLQNSGHFQPLYPVTPVPIPHGDPPKMMWANVKTEPIVRTDVPKSAPYSTLPPKLAAKMKHFQADLTKPVYLMGGTPDKILLGITIALTVVGMVGCGEFIGRYLYKK